MFALFQYDEYEPRGGWLDLVGVYNTRDWARAQATDEHEYAHIVDLDAKEIVAQAERPRSGRGLIWVEK